MYIIYLLIVVLCLGFMIASHEFGHFITAKLFGVKVNEFSIGMGPTLLSKQGQETKYCFKLLPIGGYCAMEGENEATDDPRGFYNQKPWKKIVVLAAGSVTNFITGFVLIAVLLSTANGYATTRVAAMCDNAPVIEQGLCIGDYVREVDGHRIFTHGDAMLYLSTSEYHDFVVERDGQLVTLNDLYIPMKDYTYADKEYSSSYGLLWLGDYDITPLDAIKYGTAETLSTTRSIYDALGKLITGKISITQMSGIIGISDTVAKAGVDLQAEAANGAASMWAGFSVAVRSVLVYMGVIAINLAIMNMLPIPALDGGQIVMTLINLALSKTVKREIPAKVVGQVNNAFLLALLCFMCVIMVIDVGRILFL